jgi:hypothetical protein
LSKQHRIISLAALNSFVGGFSANFYCLCELSTKFSKGKVIGVCSNTGFMSSSVDGVILGMKTILEDPLRMAELDFKVAPVPWRDQGPYSHHSIFFVPFKSAQ